MVTQTYTIASTAELAAAIAAIDQTGSEAATDTSYTFTFANSVTLGQQLDAINLDTGSSLTIIGNGDTLSGAGALASAISRSSTVTVPP